MTFTQLGVDRLRFFLRGPANQTLALYELLGAHAISVAFADNAVDPAPVIVPATAIEPVGFSPDEALLPLVGTRLLRLPPADRIFRLPGKVPVLRLHPDRHQDAGVRRQPAGDLRLPRPRGAGTGAHHRHSSRMALGCVPLVNLFRQRCEPISLNHMDTEYRIVPDARRPRAAEVWSVERVRETQPDGSFRPWRPFHRLYRQRSGARRTRRLLPHHPARGRARRARHRGVPGAARSGLRSGPPRGSRCCRSTRSASTAICRRTCRSAAAIRACVWWRARPRSRRSTRSPRPRPTLRPPLRENGFWRLVSHLSLGHLSVTGGRRRRGGAEGGAAALRPARHRRDPRRDRGAHRRHRRAPALRARPAAPAPSAAAST